MRFLLKKQTTEATAAQSSDKAFTHSFAVSVISILLCLAALCSTSWAWFSGSVSSANNEIAAASCDVTTTFTYAVTDGVETLVPNADGTYTLSAGVEYLVKISAEGSARSSYCIFTIGAMRYYTQQIATTEPDNIINFTLTFSDETVIAVSPLWGTSGRTERDLLDGRAYTEVDFQAVTP